MDAPAAQGARADLADLCNLSEFSMRLALSLVFEDSRRRLELRLRGWRPQPFQLPKGMPTANSRFTLLAAALENKKRLLHLIVDPAH